MAATEPIQSMRFMVCGLVVGALAWLQRIREQSKGLNPIVEKLKVLDALFNQNRHHQHQLSSEKVLG